MDKLKPKECIIGIVIIILVLIIMHQVNQCFFSIRNTKITKQNYQTINDTVQNNKELSLQEKVNFKKNYFLFGEKIIGYKVRDVIKKIEF